ncbi:MAG: ParB/Srx family N-terminal domain-containing protein [Candidatus Actinomarinaceae bacterium]
MRNIVYKKTSDIYPYDSNPRFHSPDQIEKVANSIKEFGWTMPVLIDENGEIIAGHGRVLAGKKLGLTEIPCIVETGWSEAKKKAYCIADNKLTESSSWENDFLKLNMEFIKDDGFDLKLTGFNDNELDKILGNVDFDIGSLEEQGQLDTKQPNVTICPHCGTEYDLNDVKLK